MTYLYISFLSILFFFLAIPRTTRVAQTVRHMGAPAAPAEESNIASMTGTTGFGAAVALGGGYAIANEVCKKTCLVNFSQSRASLSRPFLFLC